MLNALIGKISQAFIDEAVASPNLLGEKKKGILVLRMLKMRLLEKKKSIKRKLNYI